MTIKYKLFLSFFIVTALTGILGVISYNTIHSLSAELIPAIKANDKISSDMLNLRRSEKDFLNRSVKDPVFFERGTSNYLDTFESTYKQLQEKLALIQGFSKKEEIQRNSRNIARLAESYRSSFLRVVAAKRERGFKDWGKIGALRESVHDVEDKLFNIGGQEKLMVTMLMCRRHEKDYLLRDDVKYQEKLTRRVVKFKRLLADSDLSEQDKVALALLINNYKREFDSLVTLDSEIGRTETQGLTADYRYTIHQLEPLLVKNEKLFNKEVSLEVTKGMVIIVTTITAVVIVSLVLVFYLSSIISKPLRSMSEAGKKVASGDINAMLPEVTTKDEVKDIHVAMSSLIGALRYHVKK